MVKAGKHTLALASRYSPLTTSSVRRLDTRRPVTSEACMKSESVRTPDPPPTLKSIRAEFCKKYMTRLEENEMKQQYEDSEPEAPELRNLYHKLCGVIPSLSESRKKPVTSLDVVLGAIDYIRDLHQMLDEKLTSPPSITNVTTTRTSDNTSAFNAGRVPLSQLENRRPEFVTPMGSSSSDEDAPSQ